MINLLPYDHKKQLNAAKTNSKLRRYNIMLVTAVLFLGAAVGLVYVFLTNMGEVAELTVQENQSREESFANVRSRASSFQSQLSDAKSIFDSEISYSRALVNYASLFPEGTAINELKLDPNSFTTPTSLVVRITGESAAAALIQSMQNSPYVTNFERRSITINEGDASYPYSMEVSFTLTKEVAGERR